MSCAAVHVYLGAFSTSVARFQRSIPDSTVGFILGSEVYRPSVAAMMLLLSVGYLSLGRPIMSALALLSPIAAVQLTERILKVVFAEEGAPRGPYPSGHATALGALIGVAVVAVTAMSQLSLGRRFAVTAISGAALVGSIGLTWSLTVSGVHTVGEIVGGLSAGTGFVLFSALGLSQLVRIKALHI